MSGRICLITGANSGIGLATSHALAKMGAVVVLVCRDRQRGEKARFEIIQASGSKNIELMLCDLSSQQEIRALASTFKVSHDRLHVLINNAGLVPKTRQLTLDGLEMQFAVNHLAPFLLTNLLLEKLEAGAPSRIVNVSSGMYKTASLDFDNLQGEKTYKAMKFYAMTKLLNTYFTYELARRLEGTGVTVNCLGPGFTATGLGRDFSPFSRFVMKTFANKKEEGAETVIYLATSPDVEKTTGKYFEKMKETETTPLTHDRETARRLWSISERLAPLA
jgi:NAD(P)-dependent dehydrogenase (short-subunit alcohol dehydrogenase family)